MRPLAHASAVLCFVLVALTLPLSSARLYAKHHERTYTVKFAYSTSSSQTLGGAYSDEAARSTAGSVAGSKAVSAPTQLFSSRPSIGALEAAVWPEVDGVFTPQGCPNWMLDYSAFHAKQRGQPAAR
jgi:hypothetical protein